MNLSLHWLELNLWTFGIVAIICSIILFFTLRRNRMQTILSVVLFITGSWCMVYAVRYALGGTEFNMPLSVYSAFARSITFYLFTFFIPLEVILPKFWNLKRFLLALAPIIGWGISVYLLKESGMVESVVCRNINDVWDNLSSFDVWGGRFVFFLMAAAVQLFFTLSYVKHLPLYREYLAMNYAEERYWANMWLKISIYSNWIIFLTWLWGVFALSLTIFTIHNFLSIVLMVFSTVQALHLRVTPSKEDYDSLNSLEKLHDADENLAISGEAVAEDDGQESGDLLHLKSEIEEWLESEKPYVKETFQQLDIMERFGISRYMATKVFKDAFGLSFSDHINGLRIKLACDIMKQEPSLSISVVATKVGYSSPSVFSRAFNKYMDVSPTVWRKDN